MQWLSRRAVLWAMDEAPDVPPRLVAALVAVARYAGDDGRGAHPSASTVAAIIRKTERNAKKDLAELRRLGLLLPGDQRIVKDIRADKRPFVYDLPMPRGVVHDTPSSGNGVSHTTARGVADGPSGVSQATPKEVLKTSGTARASASAEGARSGASRGRPVCAECRQPFSDEWLDRWRENPDLKAAAMVGGQVYCSWCRRNEPKPTVDSLAEIKQQMGWQQ